MKRTFTEATFEPSAKFLDPRLRPKFNSRMWPLCNGEAAPQPGARGLFERRCLEFLASFYHLNVANQRLLDARKAGASKNVIKQRLERVVSATNDLEALEDRYAPIGFFGEPLMDGIHYKNIIFTRPEPPKQFRDADMQSATFAIPGLDSIPRSELRGQPKLRRFGHARLDL